MEIGSLIWRTGLVAAVAVAGAAVTHNAPAKPEAVRPMITIRVDDHRITSPTHMPAGLVDVRIVTSGKIHHHLAFWHLNRGVTKQRFLRVLKKADGDPFAIATGIGGNGPMLAGSTVSTMRMVSGTVVLADIVDGPTTEIASFEISGSTVSTTPPQALGTVVNRGFRFAMPAHFGRPGVYRFTNPDPTAHDGAIFRLAPGKRASDVVSWFQHGAKGAPPVDFSKPLGGPGAIGAHWTSWFTLPKLPPGRYLFGCFLTDSQGMLHVAMGMAADFLVR
jgi:hypothetical protein